MFSLRQLCLESAPAGQLTEITQWTNNEVALTEAQQRGLCNLFEYHVSCVQAPPGAGKTTLILAAARQLRTYTEADIMVNAS